MANEMMEKLRSNRRAVVLLAVGVVLIATVWASGDPPKAPPAAADKPQAAQGTAPAAVKPAATQPVVQAVQPARDPFAPPPGYRPADQVAAQASAGGQAGGAASMGPAVAPPALAGVVQAGGTGVAIIQLGAESRSYRVNEAVGGYRLVEVGKDYAVLAGPDGRLVLSLGR